MIINFIQLFKNLGEYLSATAVVAILLFLVKEFLEILRRRSEKNRKINAIKILLAEELEKNYWALVSIFRVLNTLKEAFQLYPRAVFWLHIARDGAEHFRMKEEPEDKYSFGCPIPKYHTVMYERLLPTLAELDKSLFEVVKNL